MHENLEHRHPDGLTSPFAAMRPSHSIVPGLLLSLMILLAASTAMAWDAGERQWKAVAAEGDKIALKVNAGVLELQYEVNVARVQQVGHLSMKQGAVELRLAEPLALKKDQVRVLFETCGMNPGAKTRGEISTWLRPMIRDAKGRVFSYYPIAYPHLNPGTEKWGDWMTPEFAVSEAGGAADQMYDVAEGNGNVRPEGELSFLGFQLLVRGKEFGRRSGKMALGGIEFPAAQFAYRDPFAYVDSLLPEAKGAYRFGLRISREFQGPPLKEVTGKLDYDPANAASRRQKIVFPLGPDDVYWIAYSLQDAGGKPVLERSLQYEAFGNPQRETPPPIDLAKPPPFGCLRINPGDPRNGVYEGTEAPAITVRAFGEAGRKIGISWQVSPYDFDTVLEKGAAETTLGGHGRHDFTLPLHWQPGRDAYRVTVTAQSQGTVLDSQSYVFGRKSDFTKPYSSRVGRPVDRESIKRHAYMRLTYIGNRAFKPKSEDEAVAEFGRELDEMSTVTRNITYMIEATDLEVLPGVYNLALVDRLMDAAADRGCALTFRIAVADGKLFPWQKYHRTRNYDGLEVRILNKNQLLPVPADPRYLAIYDRAFKALHDRYGVHPGFQGYYIMTAMGDWPDAYVELPQIGTLSGYEPATREGFRQYLRETLGLSLDWLNARWGSHYRSWDEVVQPMPDFASGALPDLRRSWLDFCEFKTSWSQKWFEHLARRIREYDPNHLIICYTERPQGLLGVADYLHNGGNHFLQLEGALVDAWEKHRLGWITEPHHPYRWAAYGDPADKGWVLDWSLFVATIQAGGGGANLHLYYDPSEGKNPVALYGGSIAMDRFAKFTTLCNELGQTTLVQPRREIGVLTDYQTTYAKHRTVFLSRTKDLRRWFELLKSDAVEFEDFRGDHLSQYKLLLPNLLDEVLSGEHLAQLDAFVRAGGRTVIAANTGKYCADNPGETFALLRRFGIAPPAGAYVTDESGVEAVAETGNPFFPAGEKIAFYSLAQQAEEKRSGKLKEPAAFSKWPYRFIPATDYFGYYRDNAGHGGKIVARFASGAVAASLHPVGKGEVLVFWGTPDIQSPALRGMMQRVAQWAGAHDPRAGSAIPHLLEADNLALHRHYAMLYQETPGTYRQAIPYAPDGEWFIDNLVTDERLGTFTGEELRKGISLSFTEGESPLKILRMMPPSRIQPNLTSKYRQIGK